MRVSRISLFVSVLLISLVLVGSASANSVSLTYTGHGKHPHMGYPFYFSINHSATLTPLICDAYDNNIHVGETWTATATPFLQGISQSMFGSSALLDYKAAGLIFESMLNGTIKSTLAGQWAIWGLFSSNAQNNPLFAQTGGASLDSQYLTLAATAPNSAFNGLVLYTPVGAKPGFGPQEFIGFSTVPEPGSLTLLGTGLLGLAGALRRKLAKG